MNGEPEAALIEQACSRDPSLAREAWRQLYERYADEVHALLYAQLRDPALAEDMLQETFLRAFRGLSQLNTRQAFRGWIRRIARNNVLDHLRKQQKARQLAGDVEDPGRSVSDRISKQEALTSAQRALERLSVEDRLLLQQRYGQGMKLTELGEAMACTERTVRNRLNRAAARLAAAVLAERKEA